MLVVLLDALLDVVFPILDLYGNALEVGCCRGCEAIFRKWVISMAVPMKGRTEVRIMH